MLTSLSKQGGNGFSWASGALMKFVNWGPGQPKKDAGDCTGILKLVVEVIPCESIAEFICEKKNIEISSKTIAVE
jgi:hypothetical protein